MFTALGSGRLKTGEEITLGVVEAPDTAWAGRLTGLLGHKRPVYRFHIESSLQAALDDLQTLYYVGLCDGAPVTVAMVAGAHGAGIYGHVYTVPEWRRRGASGLLHAALAADTRARGYRALTLGTNPEGHARRLYEGIGYRQVLPGRGDMVWRASGGQDGAGGKPPGTRSVGAQAAWQGEGSTPAPDGGGRGGGAQGAAADGQWHVGPARWGDWGWVSEACCAPPEPGEELPRSVLFRVRDAGHVEATFVEALRSGLPLHVLRDGERAVGWAALLDGPAEALGAAVLELYVRPGFRDREAIARLLAALSWPRRTVVCACGGAPGYRATALAAHGFAVAATLPAWWDLGREAGAREAAILWARRVG